VLPFLNLSGDPEQEYFSDGITEELITGLSRFRELFVIARTSSFTLKGQSVDVSDTARKLGVQYVLEGSVRKAGNRVRVTAQLIDATTGMHLWADNYDRALEDVFAVQDDVTQTIVATLMGRLEEASRERALQKRATNLSAYDYWLRGKHYFTDWKGSQEDCRQAEELFEKAIELDPEFAPAYAGLSAIYLRIYELGWTETPEVAGERALELARRAVELDDRDSSARLMLASAYHKVRSNFELAEAQIEKAIELNPNDYWNYCFKSYFLTCSGDLEEGISCGHDAVRRNPFLPDSCLWNIGFAEYFAGRYDRAIATFGTISSTKDDVDACVAACYARLGRDEEAGITAAGLRERSHGKWPIDAEGWRAYWLNKFHFKDSTALDHLIDGLQKAGLSE
jgi:adenylate cyclase